MLEVLACGVHFRILLLLTLVFPLVLLSSLGGCITTVIRMYSHLCLCWPRRVGGSVDLSNDGFGIDMWAVGCIMAELVRGDRLFGGATEEAVIAEILQVVGTNAPGPLITLPAYRVCEYMFLLMFKFQASFVKGIRFWFRDVALSVLPLYRCYLSFNDFVVKNLFCNDHEPDLGLFESDVILSVC